MISLDDADTLKVLLDQGTDHNKDDMLYIACERRAFKCIRTLVEAGADVNKSCGTYQRFPLLELIDSYGDTLPYIQYLIEHKANVNQATNVGLTPLGLAAICRNTEAARILLQNGAKVDVNRKRRPDALTTFDLAAPKTDSGIFTICKLLLEAGSKAKRTDYPADIKHLIQHFNQFKRGLVVWIGILKKRYKVQDIAPTDTNGRVPKEMVRLLSWYAWDRKYDYEYPKKEKLKKRSY